MNIYQAVILGIVQGLTEFLPVSSSGHLVLYQNLMGIHDPMIAFDVAVHWGTMLAVVLYYRKDLFRMIAETSICAVKFPFSSSRGTLFERYPYALISLFVVIACIPTGIIGVTLEDVFEKMFSSVFAVGVAWFVMGIVLIFSRTFQNGERRLTAMNHRDAFLIGLAQGIAIIPGISRSGSTIIGGMLCGIEKKEAARFSFLISIPVIVGAGVFKLKEGVEIFAENPYVLIAGVVTSAVAGYLAIAFLLKVVQRNKFFLFGFYLLAMAVFAIVYTFFFMPKS